MTVEVKQSVFLSLSSVSRGFAFVRYYRAKDAAAAIDELDGKLAKLVIF